MLWKCHFRLKAVFSWIRAQRKQHSASLAYRHIKECSWRAGYWSVNGKHTFSGLLQTNGIRAWGSVAIPHSSMRIWRALTVLVKLGVEDCVHVHSMMSCCSSSYVRASLRSFLYLGGKTIHIVRAANKILQIQTDLVFFASLLFLILIFFPILFTHGIFGMQTYYRHVQVWHFYVL